MIAFTRVEAFGGVIALLVLAVAVVTLARVVTGREARWRRVRFGIFVERDHAVEHEPEEYDWEEAPTVELKRSLDDT